MNVLVTGATGFIGRHLVWRLAKDPANNIFCLVRKSSNISCFAGLKINYIYADLSDYNSLTAITGPLDIIYHCAGYVGNSDKGRLHCVNVLGTENVCRFGLERRIKIVYTSSVAVVTANPDVPLTEDLPYGATNAYGQAKLEAEKIAIQYRDMGLKIAIIRPTMVYGPDEPHLLGVLLKLVRHRIYPLINGGRHKFHLVYVETVVDSLIFAAVNNSCLKGTYFIADKEVLTNREVMTTIARVLGVNPPWDMPGWLARLVLSLPRIGKKFKFFQKDREYSTARIESAGFRFRFDAVSALTLSCRNFTG